MPIVVAVAGLDDVADAIAAFPASSGWVLRRVSHASDARTWVDSTDVRGLLLRVGFETFPEMARLVRCVKQTRCDVLTVVMISSDARSLAETLWELGAEAMVSQGDWQRAGAIFARHAAQLPGDTRSWRANILERLPWGDLSAAAH